MLNRKGKIRAKGIIIIVLIVLVATSYGILGWWFRKNNVPDTDKMIIIKDKDFTNKYHLPGSGTKEDPFRIENYNKDIYNQIEISDTTKFFVIQNCEFVNLWGESIIISNIARGTALIYNNNFNQEEFLEDNYIHILNSHNCSIIDNNFYNNFGYFIMNGLLIEYSNSTNIYGNLIKDMSVGIDLLISHHTNILNNDFNFDSGSSSDIAITVSESHKISIIENTMRSVHEGIRCENSNDAFINKNIIKFNCWRAVDLENLLNCTFSQNEFDFISSYCVSFSSIINSTISNNIFRNSGYIGVILNHCWFNEITGNTFEENDCQGLYLRSCNNNTIWNNKFLENNLVNPTYHQQAYDNSINNWYLDILSHGNYWSDLIWNINITYPIDGGSNVDLHPLEFPV